MQCNNRSRGELTRRYVLFFISLVFISLGVSVVTRSLVGTSPISALPYVMSLNTPVTMGTYILLLNILLMVAQMFMLGSEGIRRYSAELLLQIPVSVMFGAFVDVFMAVLSFWNPDIYGFRLISLSIGCIFMAIGVSLEVIADVAMVSGEYFVHIASRRFDISFGTLKLVFDLSLVGMAVLCSLMFKGAVEGIREGTLITALVTGPLVRLFIPRLRRLAHVNAVRALWKI
ncbi:MAG: hypothetical protein K2L84_08785 [Muribaculaceae bacterium]|nr:hypothetical protein [Muribaculaceae bacterium]